VFAYVLYYKQRTDPESRRAVARWTRELIDAAVASGGRYYLPYQPVATRAQFSAAYPRSAELFAVKQQVDSTGSSPTRCGTSTVPPPMGRCRR
jgi:hypothetical protein